MLKYRWVSNGSTRSCRYHSHRVAQRQGASVAAARAVPSTEAAPDVEVQDAHEAPSSSHIAPHVAAAATAAASAEAVVASEGASSRRQSLAGMLSQPQGKRQPSRPTPYTSLSSYDDQEAHREAWDPASTSALYGDITGQPNSSSSSSTPLATRTGDESDAGTSPTSTWLLSDDDDLPPSPPPFHSRLTAPSRQRAAVDLSSDAPAASISNGSDSELEEQPLQLPDLSFEILATSSMTSRDDDDIADIAIDWQQLAMDAPSTASPASTAPIPSSSTADPGITASSDDADLSSIQLQPHLNFRDPAFEAAIGRWIQEATEWPTLRRLFQRWQHRLNSAHISSFLNRLAALRASTHRSMLRTERAGFTQLCAEVVQQAQQLAPSFSTVSLIALLQALVQLKLPDSVPTKPLVANLLHYSRPQLAAGSVTGPQLAQLAWNVGKLRQQPPPEWLSQLISASQPQLELLSIKELVMLLQGLGLLQAPVPARWAAAYFTATKERLQDMQHLELSNMMVSLARLKQQPPLDWIDVFISTTLDGFEAFDPQTYCNILWAMARLDYRPPRAWMAAYCEYTTPILSSFRTQELALVMWSLAKQRSYPGDEWLDEFFDESERRIRLFSVRDLANTSWALARMGIRPPSSWLRVLYRCIYKRRSELDPSCVHQLMAALTAFKVPELRNWEVELYTAAGMKIRYRRRRKEEVGKGGRGDSSERGGSSSRSSSPSSGMMAGGAGSASGAPAMAWRPPPVLL